MFYLIRKQLSPRRAVPAEPAVLDASLSAAGGFPVVMAGVVTLVFHPLLTAFFKKFRK